MCGIVGAFPLNKPGLEIDEALRRRVALFLHNEVLFETISRGRDATGMAVSFGPKGGEEVADTFWAVLKQPVDTEDFFLNDGTDSRYRGQEEEANVDRLLDVACLVDRPFNHVLGHTRRKTMGSEFNPLNNHPILVGNIIGIHNGGVTNHKKIYEKHEQMTQQGEVDSEVIFQLLAEQANDRELCTDDINYVTERIDGPHAVIAYNRNYPGKVIYFHNSERPLELAYIEELGLAIICSERKFLSKAMHIYNRSKMTLRRDLPMLSVSWRTVLSGKGGLIDVEKEIDPELATDDLFPLIESAKLKDEYKNKNYKHWTAGTVSKPSTSTGKTTGNQSTAAGNHHSSKSTSTGKTTSGQTQTKNKENVIPEGEICDMSEYGKDSISQSPAGQVQSVSTKAIFDDDGEETDDLQESNNVLDVYDDEDLRTKGINHALSLEAKEDENLTINKHKGRYKDLIANSSLDEDEAAEIVYQLHPEIFGDGFVVGFKRGVNENEAANEDVNEDIQGLIEENDRLKKELEIQKERQLRAAGYIANMKSFLMAAIITHHLGRVEGEGDEEHLAFDGEMEDFIKAAKGFRKTDLEMVREIFSKSDFKAIKKGMTRFAEQLHEGSESDLTGQIGKAKSIKQ